MPAVKVFNIFSGGNDKQNASSRTPMQRFYKAFSVTPEANQDKSNKVSSIAANLVAKGAKVNDTTSISVVKLHSDNVQKFLTKVNVNNYDESNSFSEIDKAELEQKTNSTFIRVGTNLLEENKGYASILETNCVVQKSGEKLESDSKLDRALESFDKIISEFSNSTHEKNDTFVPPKLQKSKTCSIIESRCILKKTLSDNSPAIITNESNSLTNSDKAKSLWNLDDMEGREVSEPLLPLKDITNERKVVDRFATYKVTNRHNQNNRTKPSIKSEDLKKLDVKTRILKKTISNPPSTPVPVVMKNKFPIRKVERKNSDPKKSNSVADKKKPTPKSDKTDNTYIHKTNSVWEICEREGQKQKFERTKSTLSLSGSSSRIPVVRNQISQQKFTSTRALFSPTPGDLSNVDQSNECISKKPIPKKPPKIDSRKQTVKVEQKRATDKSRVVSPKSSLRECTNELNAVRAKLQLKRQSRNLITKRLNNSDAESIDTSTLSPVKAIVKKLELKTAKESKLEPTNFVSCKIIAPPMKEVCVANMTFHNHLTTLVARQVKIVNSKKDSVVSRTKVEKTFDNSSECSDDSGHVSNENEETFFKKCEEVGSAVTPVAGCNEVVKADQQIFFRPGVVASLDARRDAAIARVLVRIQARARGLLARRRATKLRTQHTAARCIQRNVRAFLAVREWPWWRLLVRVTPLLAVHRTEERLKSATDEVEAMRAKIEKLESERAHLKTENDRLENKLSEYNGELCEERASAASATERAEAEAAERLRVEKEARELAANNEKLAQASERLELELLHWRSASEVTGLSDSEADSADGEAAERYKKRYERAARELQLVKTQLRRQHEDDLEQLVMVKKQLDKKVADAFEEVEEQRAVAAQWKRKVQKLTNDMADLRSLLDEQTCRNNLLEKRQRKFDSELASLNEELRKEKSTRERLSAERESLVADKSCTEQTIQDLKLELELKDERIASLSREVEECGGVGGGEGELSSLRKCKATLERKLRDQEEELEDLAGQIQLLESSKLRLEMSLEQQRKEARLEAVQRDDELEEARANHAKKIKMLECQLETEHSERTLLLRERHELERRLATLEDVARSENQEQSQLIQRLKRDLKRYRALLRDAQTMLEQKEKEGGSKAQIRQLKNQVEELEVSLRASNKAKSAAEAEASEASAALEEATRARTEAAERANRAMRELAGLKSQLDDAEDELQELMTKYRTSTTQLVNTQALVREAENKSELAAEEVKSLKEKLAEANSKLARQTQGNEASEIGRRLELRTKELESSLELEQTSRSRLEAQLSRARDQHDKLAAETKALRLRLADSDDHLRKLTKQLRESREEIQTLHSKLDESQRLKATSEAQLTATKVELATARDEARLAARRAAALHDAIHADLSSTNNSPDSESENDSYSSDESIETFLANHKLSPSVPSRSASQQVERMSESRLSLASTSPKLSGRESRA